MSAIDNFVQVTGCNDYQLAEQLLRKHRLHLNDAIDDYYTNHLSQGSHNNANLNVEALEAIFSQYADNSDNNIMDLDGTIAYFTDLGIDVENDPQALVAAYILESPSTGVFNRDKFIKNWGKVQPSIKSISDMSEYLNSALNDNILMKNVYKFAFKYALEEGQRKLETDDVVALWKCFYQNEFKNLEINGVESTVTKFVNDYIGGGNCRKTQISQDEWNMAYQFFQIPLNELSQYEESSAWPVLMDEFVDFLLERE